jgi:hypothetical protein
MTFQHQGLGQAQSVCQAGADWAIREVQVGVTHEGVCPVWFCVLLTKKHGHAFLFENIFIKYTSQSIK